MRLLADTEWAEPDSPGSRDWIRYTALPVAVVVGALVGGLIAKTAPRAGTITLGIAAAAGIVAAAWAPKTRLAACFLGIWPIIFVSPLFSREDAVLGFWMGVLNAVLLGILACGVLLRRLRLARPNRQSAPTAAIRLRAFIAELKAIAEYISIPVYRGMSALEVQILIIRVTIAVVVASGPLLTLMPPQLVEPYAKARQVFFKYNAFGTFITYCAICGTVAADRLAGTLKTTRSTGGLGLEPLLFSFGVTVVVSPPICVMALVLFQLASRTDMELTGLAPI
jgi:hypothetical protein